MENQLGSNDTQPATANSHYPKPHSGSVNPQLPTSVDFASISSNNVGHFIFDILYLVIVLNLGTCQTLCSERQVRNTLTNYSYTLDAIVLSHMRYTSDTKCCKFMG